MSTTVQRLGILSAALLLSACAHHNRPVVQDNAPVYSESRSDPGSRRDHRGYREDRRSQRNDPYVEFGVVSSLDPVHASQTTSGGGAVIGGVAGAVVGRQFGEKGGGRALGTALGAFVGVILGNEIERQNSKAQGYTRVRVQLEQGGERQFNLSQSADLRVGDRVRIENNQVFRM
jgi:outer membrane lipoprotein SlyB